MLRLQCVIARSLKFAPLFAFFCVQFIEGAYLELSLAQGDISKHHR